MGPTQSGPLVVTPEDGRDYKEIEIPEALGRRIRSMMGLTGSPKTFGGLEACFEASDSFVTEGSFTWQDLLVSDGETPHEARVGDEVFHTYCVLDALVLPFVLEERVAIRSRPPKGGTVIEMDATPDRLKAKPRGAVVSFGASLGLPETTDKAPQEDPEGLLDLTHEEGCPTINSFPNVDAYRAWDQDTDAVTVVLTLAQAYALAHDSSLVL